MKKIDKKMWYDSYFREEFGKKSFALSFFRKYLPEIVSEKIDWKKFRKAPTDFVKKA